MPAISSPPKALIGDNRLSQNSVPLPKISVGLLTGGKDPHYVFGLATVLASKGVCLDLIGSDEVDSPELRCASGLHFLNLRGSQPRDAGLVDKISRVLAYYLRLIRYAASAKVSIFHILWNNKFETFDRTLLTLYYKMLGKKLVLTVHNVNAGKRDSNDSWLNRITLKIQYRLMDHLFVHTGLMKKELIQDFGVREQDVTVIPYGINNSVPDTSLTCADAKRRLGLRMDEKVILFYGTIRPYKGVDHLVRAFWRLAKSHADYRLIVAGEPKKESEKYAREIQDMIEGDACQGQVVQQMRYIPDAETEVYFKAADVLVLPYREIFQSGVLFLGYSFGLPVIAADVGSLREEIVEGRTGFLCPPGDPDRLADAIETYFTSDLFKDLDNRRQDIRAHANALHSWDIVGEMTRGLYAGLGAVSGRP
jgi:D-inositol-3-phosphate glycosyltransferase